MKMTIPGVICPKCKGEGHREETRIRSGAIEPVKIICGYCNGEGVVRFQGAREGIAWERE